MYSGVRDARAALQRSLVDQFHDVLGKFGMLGFGILDSDVLDVHFVMVRIIDCYIIFFVGCLNLNSQILH